MKRARGKREGEDEKREPVDHHSTKCEVCAARETEKEREYQRMKKEKTKGGRRDLRKDEFPAIKWK